MNIATDILALAGFTAAFCALVAYQDWREHKMARTTAERIKADTEQHRPRHNPVFMRDFAKRLNGGKKA